MRNFTFLNNKMSKSQIVALNSLILGINLFILGFIFAYAVFPIIIKNEINKVRTLYLFVCSSVKLKININLK